MKEVVCILWICGQLMSLMSAELLPESPATQIYDLSKYDNGLKRLITGAAGIYHNVKKAPANRNSSYCGCFLTVRIPLKAQLLVFPTMTVVTP